MIPLHIRCITILIYKRRTFEAVVARAGRSLFKCPLLLSVLMSVHFRALKLAYAFYDECN
jgi:hypothetical protein